MISYFQSYELHHSVNDFIYAAELGTTRNREGVQGGFVSGKRF
jgi:hypothetical protein